MISNKKKAMISVARMKAWLATSPVIPTHRGRINKSRICNILDIPVSTIRTNRELGELFSSLSGMPVTAPNITISERATPAMQELVDRLAEQEILIEKLTSENMQAQFLLSTGIILL